MGRRRNRQGEYARRVAGPPAGRQFPPSTRELARRREDRRALRGHGTTPEHPQFRKLAAIARPEGERYGGRRAQNLVDRRGGDLNGSVYASDLRRAINNLKGPRLALSVTGEMMSTTGKVRYKRKRDREEPDLEDLDLEAEPYEATVGGKSLKAQLLRDVEQTMNGRYTVDAEALARLWAPGESGADWVWVYEFTFSEGVHTQGPGRR